MRQRGKLRTIGRRGEDVDSRLREQVPADQKDEYDRVNGAVDNANTNLNWALVFEQLYLFETEIQLAWLESLAPALEPVRILEQALKARGVRVREGSPRKAKGDKDAEVIVPPIPVATRGFDLREPAVRSSDWRRLHQPCAYAAANLSRALVARSAKG